MKKIKITLFVGAMFALTTACQTSKTESEKTMQDTATVVESETIVKGDSMEVITDSAKIAIPDSVRK